MSDRQLIDFKYYNVGVDCKRSIIIERSIICVGTHTTKYNYYNTNEWRLGDNIMNNILRLRNCMFFSKKTGHVQAA